MEEIMEKWGNPAGKDLFFTGTMTDYYYLETLTGTAISHVYRDGVQFKLIGNEIRTFKPGTPFTIQVGSHFSDQFRNAFNYRDPGYRK